mmetsp:Transcript_93324/g.266992  ORF Transcript_93324/g.266992 Transcript_93324/m.266992 type:complete len:151 (-) Transcript_93324:18-470(-)
MAALVAKAMPMARVEAQLASLRDLCTQVPEAEVTSDTPKLLSRFEAAVLSGKKACPMPSKPLAFTVKLKLELEQGEFTATLGVEMPPSFPDGGTDPLIVVLRDAGGAFGEDAIARFQDDFEVRPAVCRRRRRRPSTPPSTAITPPRQPPP